MTDGIEPTNQRRKLLLGALVFACGATIFSVVYLRSLPVLAPLPSPNGYHAFVVAGRALIVDPRAYHELPEDRLRTLVESNAPVIELVREGLRHESRIPYEFTQEYFDGHITELHANKSIAQVICAASRLAALEERHADAAELALLGVQFSHESSRGGIVVDWLSWMACEAIALARLEPLTHSLSATQCQFVSTELANADAKRQQMGEFLKTDERYWRETTPVRDKLRAQINQRSINAYPQVTQVGIQRFNKADRQRRQLILIFAARARELETGHKPTNLVPTYLKAIPKDPDTGQDLPLP